MVQRPSSLGARQERQGLDQTRRLARSVSRARTSQRQGRLLAQTVWMRQTVSAPLAQRLLPNAFATLATQDWTAVLHVHNVLQTRTRVTLGVRLVQHVPTWMQTLARTRPQGVRQLLLAFANLATQDRTAVLHVQNVLQTRTKVTWGVRFARHVPT